MAIVYPLGVADYRDDRAALRTRNSELEVELEAERAERERAQASLAEREREVRELEARLQVVEPVLPVKRESLPSSVEKPPPVPTRWIAIGVMTFLLAMLVAGLGRKGSVYGMHPSIALGLAILLGCALMLVLGWPRKEQ